MRFAGKEMTRDEAILTSEGTLMCMSAAALFAKPAWAQDKLLKGGLGGATRSDPMARLAGIALGAQGAHVLLAGRADRVTQRRSAKITAATSAVVSGCALTALGSNSDSANKNKLIGVAVLGALNAAVTARMAYREDKLL